MPSLKNNSKNKIGHIACILSLIINTLPVVDLYCSWYVTAIPIVVFVVWAVMKNTRNINFAAYILAFMMLFILFEYYIVYSQASFFNYFVNTFLSLIPCLTAYLLKINEDDKRFYDLYLQLAAILMGITAITTIVGLEKYPAASREMASGVAMGFDVDRYYRANIGGYSFIYALVLFVPVAFWLIEHTKGIRKAVNVGVLVATIVCVYQSQYTIALITLVISFFVVWANKHPVTATITAGIVLVILLLGGLTLLSDLFVWASESVESEYVSDKLLQVSQLLKGQTVNTDTSNDRIECYLQEFAAFSQNPVIGVNMFGYTPDSVSGHTTVMDIMGGSGLLGLGLLFFIFRKLYVAVLRQGYILKNQTIRAVWTILFVIACLNTSVFPLIATIVFMCTLCIAKMENPAPQKDSQKGE